MTATDPEAQVRELWSADAADARRRAVLYGLETHGSCVLARGSLRTFRDGGFVDVQPSWTYFFRAGRLVRTAEYLSRAEALAAIAEFNAAAP